MLARELITHLKMYIISNVKLCKSFTIFKSSNYAVHIKSDHICFSGQCIFMISAEFSYLHS